MRRRDPVRSNPISRIAVLKSPNFLNLYRELRRLPVGPRQIPAIFHSFFHRCGKLWGETEAASH